MTIFIKLGPLGMARRQLRAGSMLDMAVRAVRMGRSNLGLFFLNSPVLGLSSSKSGLFCAHVGVGVGMGMAMGVGMAMGMGMAMGTGMGMGMAPGSWAWARARACTGMGTAAGSRPKDGSDSR